MTRFTSLMARDLRLVWRRPGDIAVVLAFFVVAASLFPLSIGPEPNLLARIAAGVLWCTALFASMLSLERLFATDYEDGSLDLLLLAPWPLELAALAKCAAHWIVTGLPLALLAPILGVAFGLPAEGLCVLAVALLVGTPTLSLLGGLAAALTLGARRGGALLALLALPLCVPTLIFGASAVETALIGEGLAGAGATGLLGILLALALVALATTPWAIAAALRQAGE
jgi:heme exporter protein B